MKDIIPRYKVMKGYRVIRKAGWDTHGLPVELEVEKMLGINGKPQIEEYGVEPFIKKCKESVWKNEKAFSDLTVKMGQFIDLEHPYVTYDNNYIETEWWILKKFFDEGLFYEGVKITPYCPRCGTELSTHEVAEGYKEIDVNSKLILLNNEVKLGVSIITIYDYDVSNDVSLKFGNKESGPSGGLMFTLSIYNKLVDEDITKGRKIVGTGTIDADGNVGEIGGVKYKLKGAVKAKADIFICPYENYDEVMELKNRYNYDIEIIKVSTFDEAIEKLK